MTLLWNGTQGREGCDSNFEVYIFQFLKVAPHEISILHLTICTSITLEIYDNNDQEKRFSHEVQSYQLINWLRNDYVYFKM